MERNETKGQLIAGALAVCPPLDQPSTGRDELWFAVQGAICTRGVCSVTPLGSSSSIPVTSDQATDELLAAMEWLIDHELEARALSPHRLFIMLRGVATRGASGSARVVQRDQLHGMTHVPPGDPVVFSDADPGEFAS